MTGMRVQPEVAAVPIALRLARAHPQAFMPCPICTAGVRGENLERHVSKKHSGEWFEGSRGDHRAVTLTLAGTDRRVGRRLLAALVVAAAVAAVLTGSGIAVESYVLPLAAALVTASLALLLIRFRAHVDVRAHEVRLHRALGLGGRRVQLPAQLAVGALVESRLDPTMTSAFVRHDINVPSQEVRAGTYLRVSRGRARITVGCKTSTDIRKHWSGWRQDKRRRGWDITLDRAGFVALQYALAEGGHLTLRSDVVRAGGD